jgi:hypothetical protein
MTELEKIAYAKTYVDQLANGLDPLTGQAVPDSEIINNVRVSRCLFYVSDVLRQILENGGFPRREAKAVKAPFQLDYEARKGFCYSAVPLTISELGKRINALIQPETMKKLNYKYILDWLTESGFLKFVPGTNGKMARVPTERGTELGIAVKQRQGSMGTYTAVVYDKAAQQFILDNLDAAIALSQK